MTDPAPYNPDDQAERILAAIVQSSDDAIIGKDLDGNILTWNHGAERLYGYTAAEARGRSIALIMPADRRAELPEFLARVREGQSVDHQQTIRRAKDGRLITVVLTVSPIRDGSGTIVGAATIARDITERIRAEAELRTSEMRWRSIVESAIDGIVVIDQRGSIEAFNPAAERLFGYGEAEVLGCNVSMLMPSPYREEHDGYISKYLESGVAKIIGIGREVTGLRRDGTTFPLRLAVSRVDGLGGEPRFTGIIHDLSARVRMEAQLREQEALVRLGEMAAVIAHEVKNPLAGIRGAIQVIGGRLPPDGREAAVAKEIVARIDGLNDLVKDLLLFARPPQPHPAPLDITALVTATAALLKQDPAVDHVKVDVLGSSGLLMADPELLKIVFVNLFMNGAHAMQGQGSIRVAVQSVDGSCRIVVQDSGPGMPPEVLQKIFTPFFTTKSRGTGLGLPTAKRIVEAHGGTIRVDCPATGGTTVTIELPLAVQPS
jgi:two-component system sensor kinase FixL